MEAGGSLKPTVRKIQGPLSYNSKEVVNLDPSLVKPPPELSTLSKHQ